MSQTGRHHGLNLVAEVAEKVNRRIEIAKVARNLQDCLAFASFKAQNGWQDRTLSTIEPEITEKLARRKRTLPTDLYESSSVVSDDLASSSSSHHTYVLRNATRSYAEPRKRIRSTSNLELERDGVQAWATRTSFAQLSPVTDRPHSAEAAQPSLEDSPMFDAPSASEDEGQDHVSKQPASSSVLSSSPPRTPPPTHRRNLAASKQAGAELLLHLSHSPQQTPAVHIHHISSTSKALSTPPQINAAYMQTPGTITLPNGLQTPSNFNLADFCNVTPSPAHARSHQTSSFARTPARSTKRNLNFESLAPPNLHAGGPRLGSGFAIQLASEHVSR